MLLLDHDPDDDLLSGSENNAADELLLSPHDGSFQSSEFFQNFQKKKNPQIFKQKF